MSAWGYDRLACWKPNKYVLFRARVRESGKERNTHTEKEEEDLGNFNSFLER